MAIKKHYSITLKDIINFNKKIHSVLFHILFMLKKVWKISNGKSLLNIIKIYKIIKKLIKILKIFGLLNQEKILTEEMESQ